MADDNKVEVKFGAQTSEIEAGSKKASDAVKGATDQMKASFDGMKSSITSFHSDVTGHFESLTATITKFSNAFIAIGAVLAGGAMFKSAIDEFVNMNSEAKKLSVIMNSSIGDAQAFLESYKRVGVEGENVTRSMMKMVMTLRTNEDAFKRNNIEVRDLGTGALLPLNEIFFNVITRLKEMEGTTGQTMLASELLGRSLKEMPGILKNTLEKVEEMRERIAGLGITLDDVSAAKAKAFKEGIYDVDLVMRSLKYKIGEELNPVLINLANFFADVGPPAIKAFGAAFLWCQDILMRLTIIVAQLRNGFLQFIEVMGILGKLAKDVAHGIIWDFSEIGPAVDAAYKSMEASSSAWALQAVRDANDVKFSVMSAMTAKSGKKAGISVMEGQTQPTQDKPERPEDTYVPKGGGGGGKGGESSVVQQWQAELDQKKLMEKAFQDQSLEMEKTFRAKMLALGRTATKEEEDALKASQKAAEVTRLQEEQNHWKSKLDIAGVGTKEYDTVEHKIVTLEMQINKARLQGEIDTIKAKGEADKQGAKDYEALLDHQRKLDKLDLDMKKANVDHLSKLGKLTKAEELKEYRKLLLDEQKLDLDAEQKKLISYERDKVLYAKHLKDIELLKKKQEIDVVKIDNQIAEAQSSTWGQALSGIASSFTSAFQSMMQAGATFGSVMASLGQSILNVFLNIISKIVQEWLMGFLMEVIGAKTADTAKVLSAAGVAGAYGFASVMATVPFPANIALAPEIAALSFAGAAGYASAAGGWDVPSDSMAMLHKNEMVLPVSLADNVRNMTGGEGAQITVNFAPHINHRMTQSEWHAESMKMLKAINRQLTRFGKAPLGPSYA